MYACLRACIDIHVIYIYIYIYIYIHTHTHTDTYIWCVSEKKTVSRGNKYMKHSHRFAQKDRAYRVISLGDDTTLVWEHTALAMCNMHARDNLWGTCIRSRDEMHHIKMRKSVVKSCARLAIRVVKHVCAMCAYIYDICVYVCVCVCVYIYIYIYIYECTHMFIHVDQTQSFLSVLTCGCDRGMHMAYMLNQAFFTSSTLLHLSLLFVGAPLRMDCIGSSDSEAWNWLVTMGTCTPTWSMVNGLRLTGKPEFGVCAWCLGT